MKSLTIAIDLNVYHDEAETCKRSGAWDAWEQDILRAYVKLWQRDSNDSVCWIHVSKYLSRTKLSCVQKAARLDLKSKRKTESRCPCVECSSSHRQVVRSISIILHFHVSIMSLKRITHTYKITRKSTLEHRYMQNVNC